MRQTPIVNLCIFGEKVAETRPSPSWLPLINYSTTLSLSLSLSSTNALGMSTKDCTNDDIAFSETRKQPRNIRFVRGRVVDRKDKQKRRQI